MDDVVADCLFRKIQIKWSCQRDQGKKGSDLRTGNLADIPVNLGTFLDLWLLCKVLDEGFPRE